VCVTVQGYIKLVLVLVYARSFYSSRSGIYNETQGPTGGLKVVETIYCTTLTARSSK
jgi:hypothetical protein